MRPDKATSFQTTLNIANKELKLFFASPIGYLFIAVFVAATLFIFFWVESFFARNISDVRPMFEWMPILLIFLSAALTMRMWSEERRSGTLEHVVTLPVSTWQFVLGKFTACKTLLAIALLLTLPIPITVSLIGNLDWGPVISGYVATILLGCAYIAIGLFVSARSDNQIVSLIISVLLCGSFYLLGSGVFTNLLGNAGASLLHMLGTGSRFESITRGVLDIRDFYYYISITLFFLLLNRYSLEKNRWADDAENGTHHRWRLATGLALANIIALNFILAPLTMLRIDTTQGQIYSISDATRGYLQQLQEPLIIRGYFSEKTHPLLAPLVPQVNNLLQEYAAESHGNVRVEIVDPASDPKIEEEAGSKYGIKPVPFRVSDRYESAVVNSYFNILIEYGDEYKVLSFNDMIEVKARSESDIDVRLRNPEYDITNAIKKVLYAYQAGGNLFDSINTPVKLSAYISPDSQLPQALTEFNAVIREELAKRVAESRGKFTFEFIDPTANGGQVAQDIEQNYGFLPMASSLFDDNTFYYYLVLQSESDLAIQLSLPEDFTADAFDRALDAGLKRFASGFTKTIGFVAPQANPYAAQMGQPAPATFTSLQQSLNENATTKTTDLSTGKVPEDIDLLMVMAPENLDEKSVFALDQYLMKGGTVVMATSPFKANFNQSSINAADYQSGLADWLSFQGVDIQKRLVLDPQSSAFPIPVPRQVGMFTVQEMMLVDYPFFAEVREQGLNQDSPVTSGLVQLTVPWASPIALNGSKNAKREVLKLVETSAGSWLSSSTDISPKANPDGSQGFAPGAAAGAQLVAAAITGRFDSYYAGKESPLLKDPVTPEGDESATPEDQQETEVIGSVIEHSPESARLVVISSNSFAEEAVLRMLGSMAGTSYVNPLQMMVNIADWSLDDEGLLSIRSRGHFNRTLPPMEDATRETWEMVNYVLAVFGLISVYLAVLWRKQMRSARYQKLLATIPSSSTQEQ
ncbi:Gldg family protein [Teredinibacter turnerae]|uniref:Gldg family protein n=1 Tax=Teredinibacter turnerae TaxID=2426 RepID=UPI0005F875A0|nr:Gldg family protein [Teredinibacter turnerae]